MNSLKNSSSPYLLQHASNPVEWYPWGPEALDKALRENKLLIISIGYSACHWCHVMEHESFEDEEVATVMNKFFVCIKVDREERPDIDALYMEAVQMLSGQGGWPLNCITLPDQRPVYGGTYFPKDQWRSTLLQLAQLWETDPDKCNGYATELTDGLIKSAKQLIPSENEESLIDFEKIFSDWSVKFDKSNGGMGRAPKFPMPDNYRYLLAWSQQNSNAIALDHVSLTLSKMARGGIYDQLGGGFARYSTDMEWKVPHFEKMLYDNAQLVVLFSEAWQKTKNPFFKEIVIDIFSFVERELTNEEGGFYSALDADSEGVEGKFYVWTIEKLREVLANDFLLFKDYFQVNEKGYWEDENYILLRTEIEEAIAEKHALTIPELKLRISECKVKLLAQREQRIHPGLDTKILCSWNALMIRAYAYAGAVFNNNEWTENAMKQMHFLQDKLRKKDQQWLHLKPGRNEQEITAFIDDYAFVIEAMITLYQATFNESWITEALSACEIVVREFSVEDSSFFYYTSVNAEKLLTRRIELQDNVTPSGNAVMAENLYALGILSGNANYVDRSNAMVKRMQSEIVEMTPWYSRWALQALLNSCGRNEVVFAGADARKLCYEWMQEYHPASLLAGAEVNSGLSLLYGRIPEDGSTLIFVCRNRACELPVKTLSEAQHLISV